jgi:hypothetical protein
VPEELFASVPELLLHRCLRAEQPLRLIADSDLISRSCLWVRTSLEIVCRFELGLMPTFTQNLPLQVTIRTFSRTFFVRTEHYSASQQRVPSIPQKLYADSGIRARVHNMAATNKPPGERGLEQGVSYSWLESYMLFSWNSRAAFHGEDWCREVRSRVSQAYPEPCHDGQEPR